MKFDVREFSEESALSRVFFLVNSRASQMELDPTINLISRESNPEPPCYHPMTLTVFRLNFFVCLFKS